MGIDKVKRSQDLPSIGADDIGHFATFEVDGSDVSAQKPGKLPLVFGVLTGAVCAKALALFDDQNAFLWPFVGVGFVTARHCSGSDLVMF